MNTNLEIYQLVNTDGEPIGHKGHGNRYWLFGYGKEYSNYWGSVFNDRRLGIFPRTQRESIYPDPHLLTELLSSKIWLKENFR